MLSLFLSKGHFHLDQSEFDEGSRVDNSVEGTNAVEYKVRQYLPLKVVSKSSMFLNSFWVELRLLEQCSLFVESNNLVGNDIDDYVSDFVSS